MQRAEQQEPGWRTGRRQVQRTGQQQPCRRQARHAWSGSLLDQCLKCWRQLGGQHQAGGGLAAGHGGACPAQRSPVQPSPASSTQPSPAVSGGSPRPERGGRGTTPARGAWGRSVGGSHAARTARAAGGERGAAAAGRHAAVLAGQAGRQRHIGVHLGAGMPAKLFTWARACPPGAGGHRALIRLLRLWCGQVAARWRCPPGSTAGPWARSQPLPPFLSLLHRLGLWSMTGDLQHTSTG